MKKITFLALHLGYGGIEKCISNVANLLSNDYKIEILTTYKLHDKEAYPLNKNIEVKYLTNVVPNRKELRYDLKHLKIISLVKEIFKAIKVLYLKKKTMKDAIINSDSDIIISSRIYFNKILSKYGKCKKIAWEHNHHHNDKKYIKSFISSCKNIDKVVLVSKELKEYYKKLFNEQNIKCEAVYIPNFVEISNKRSKLDNNNLICVGRLSKEKGILDLINVFKIVEMEEGNVKLNIIGDGLEYQNIKKKIIGLNLTRKIKLLGYKNTDEINKYYQESCLYLMTSYTESFGLVLVEAMSCGIPCLAFDSAEGANDIIKNDYNGYLIKNRNEHEMANIILKLLKDRKKLKELGDNSYKTSKKYSKENTKKYWLDLLG